MEDRVAQSSQAEAPKDETEVLAQLVRWREAHFDATHGARGASETARDYYDGKQWSEEEIATLKKRKQPVVTDNRIKKKVDFLRGLEAQRRTDPKAYPRNPGDDDGAQAATDALRFVADEQRWDRKRSENYDTYLVEGACGLDIAVVKKEYEGKPEFCIEWRPIHWDRMWWDPHSRKRDFSDAKYKGQDVWMDLEDAVKRWPDKKDALNSTLSTSQGTQGDTSDDVPRLRWTDPKRKRVLISECWSYEGGKCYFSQFTKGAILDRMESPYKDEDGEPEDGFVFGSCMVDRDGNRYGPVHGWISTQDEINKRRSKALHLMSVRQTWGERGAVEDVRAAKNELAKPDGHIETVPGFKFDVLKTGDMAAAQFQLLQEAQNSLDSVGVNASLTGTDDRALSGRAQMVRQESGLAELGPVIDGFNQFQYDVYRMTWNRIKQFWTQEKWVRVTDDEKNVKFVGLNTPLTAGEQAAKILQHRGQLTPETEAAIRAKPEAAQIVGVKNDVAQMDVDIVIEDAPATASLQVEQFDIIAKLGPHMASMPPPMVRALIKASQLRNKDAILEELQGGGMPPQAQQAIDEMKKQLEQTQKALEDAQAALQQKDETIEKSISDAAKEKTRQDEFAFKREELDFKRDELDFKRETMNNEHAATMTDIEGRNAEAVAAHDAGLSQTIGPLLQQLSESLGAMATGMQQISAGQQAIAEGQAGLAELMRAPREIVRDKNGRPTGARILTQ